MPENGTWEQYERFTDTQGISQLPNDKQRVVTTRSKQNTTQQQEAEVRKSEDMHKFQSAKCLEKSNAISNVGSRITYSRTPVCTAPVSFKHSLYIYQYNRNYQCCTKHGASLTLVSCADLATCAKQRNITMLYNVFKFG